MKRIVFLLLAVTCCLSMTAQSKDEMTSLYQYGKPLKTCETNFENLFANLPKYVDTGGALKLLSYEKVGAVRNKRQVIRLTKKNYSHYPFFAVGTRRRSRGHSDGHSDDVHVESYVCIRPTDDMTLYNKDKIAKIVSQKVSPGDSIYLLRFTFLDEAYKQYVFIDSETKETIDEDFFGFDIPVAHIEYCNQKVNESKQQEP